MGRHGRLWILGITLAAATLALTLIVAVGTAAVDGSGAERAAGKRAGLKAFASCDGLRRHLRSHPSALGRSTLPMTDVFADADSTTAPEAGGGEAAADAAPSPGSTNVQEAGVDEPDIVKAQGEIVYAVAGGRLHAVDASGPVPVLLGSLELPDGPGAQTFAGEPELLVHGDRALVISPTYAEYGAAFGEATLLIDVSIADPAQMSVERTALAEGHYVSSRLTGSTARLVVSTQPPVRVAPEGNGRALVPRLRLNDRVAGQRSARKLVGCGDVRRPSRFAGAEMLTVLTVDLSLGLPAVDADAVMTAGEIVYASPTSLYVATERWFGAGARRAELSDVSTRVHRFDVSVAGATEYVATGAVPGFMLSQWSMSEHEGVLRVASTTVPPWREGEQIDESQSFLTALAPDGDRLREVGRVGGLGEGEQIYAVRMIGERAYVVTFRQVDPLYVLDLSNATDPRVIGELKVPGYSAYLHPVGEGFLLGVGQDATMDGATQGVQVSLFDVRDPANPVRLDRETFGRWSYSEVEYDHHAFSLFAERLAVIPIEGYAGGRQSYDAVGLEVDPAGADPLGRVAKLSHGSSYEERIRRSLLVGGRVLALSASRLTAHDPAALTELGTLSFPAG